MRRGLAPYRSMLRQRRFRLIPYYMREVHLFDLLNGTNTGGIVEVSDFPENLVNRGSSVAYMASWTSSVKAAFRLTCGLLGEDAYRGTTFVDVGCGKGKAALVWAQEARRTRTSFRVIGVDFNSELLDIARVNAAMTGAANDISFVMAEASSIPTNIFDLHNVLYLYNPFGGDVVRSLLERVRSTVGTIVYVNPVHLEVFAEYDYQLVGEVRGWHPASHITVLRRGGSAT